MKEKAAVPPAGAGGHKNTPRQERGALRSSGKKLHSAAGGEAFAAVDGTIFLRLEGNLGRTAALSTDRVIHHTRSAGSRAIRLAGLTAGLTAGGLVLEALFGVEFLFPGGEHEFLATVFAYQRFVFVHG